MSKVFALDANVFIEAKQRYYSFDICPGFWDSLVWNHGAGRIVSIDRVKRELEKIHDPLHDWATQEMDAACFRPSDDATTARHFGQMMSWVQNHSRFLPQAKADFADRADGWLAAFAKTHDFVLVTHEVRNPSKKNKVPLPDVCQQFQVDVVNTFEMLRGLQSQFHWSRPEA